MSIDHLRYYTHRTIGPLLARDASLLQQKSSERAIRHRLAVYLESDLVGRNIDCEYNRQGLEYDTKHDMHANPIRPDIVIHHRRHYAREYNLLVIEVKKILT